MTIGKEVIRNCTVEEPKNKNVGGTESESVSQSIFYCGVENEKTNSKGVKDKRNKKKNIEMHNVANKCLFYRYIQ